MRKPVALLIPSVVLVAALTSGCSKEPPPPQVERPTITIDPAELTAFAPLPDEVPAAGHARILNLVIGPPLRNGRARIARRG